MIGKQRYIISTAFTPDMKGLGFQCGHRQANRRKITKETWAE